MNLNENEEVQREIYILPKCLQAVTILTLSKKNTFIMYSSKSEETDIVISILSKCSQKNTAITLYQLKYIYTAFNLKKNCSDAECHLHFAKIFRV